jgi:hypothetical protein
MGLMGIKGEVDKNRRAQLVDGLARGLSVEQAAKESGYSRVQAFRIKRKKEFLDEVERRRVQLGIEPKLPAGSRDARILKLELDALRMLETVMEGKTKATAAQIKAAQMLLSHAARCRPPRVIATPEARAGTGEEEVREGGPRPAERGADPLSDEEQENAERYLDGDDE